ncbi:hypothetical protein Tcan_03876 [Toxocara canis]|uniref:Uncharacterized protein n=1 Tax=Toxocara canis TaxID=6265 RepID=A0A0B2UY33_TOXCA|nr:hypothetical protein Tcan_03876 [Toxocara canis]
MSSIGISASTRCYPTVRQVREVGKAVLYIGDGSLAGYTRTARCDSGSNYCLKPYETLHWNYTNSQQDWQYDYERTGVAEVSLSLSA